MTPRGSRAHVPPTDLCHQPTRLLSLCLPSPCTHAAPLTVRPLLCDPRPSLPCTLLSSASRLIRLRSTSSLQPVIHSRERLRYRAFQPSISIWRFQVPSSLTASFTCTGTVRPLSSGVELELREQARGGRLLHCGPLAPAGASQLLRADIPDATPSELGVPPSGAGYCPSLVHLFSDWVILGASTPSTPQGLQPLALLSGPSVGVRGALLPWPGAGAGPLRWAAASGGAPVPTELRGAVLAQTPRLAPFLMSFPRFS